MGNPIALYEIQIEYLRPLIFKKEYILRLNFPNLKIFL